MQCADTFPNILAPKTTDEASAETNLSRGLLVLDLPSFDGHHPETTEIKGTVHSAITSRNLSEVLGLHAKARKSSKLALAAL